MWEIKVESGVSGVEIERNTILGRENATSVEIILVYWNYERNGRR